VNVKLVSLAFSSPHSINQSWFRSIKVNVEQGKKKGQVRKTTMNWPNSY